MLGFSVPQSLSECLESSTIALALALPKGDHPLLFVNARFTELSGYSPHELLGRNCRLLQRGVVERQAHAKIRAFLGRDDASSVRTPMINFRKDGTPFVNLLYMSRLRALTGETRFILASQFDVSRAHPERLQAYDHELAQALIELGPLATECGMTVDRSLTTIADAVSVIAQATLALDNLDKSQIASG